RFLPLLPRRTVRSAHAQGWFITGLAGLRSPVQTLSFQLLYPRRDRRCAGAAPRGTHGQRSRVRTKAGAVDRLIRCLPSPASPRSAERLERGPQFLNENHRLLPGGKVAALLGMMVVDEVGIGLLCPAPRRLILLAGEDADRYGDLNALRVKVAALI